MASLRLQVLNTPLFCCCSLVNYVMKVSLTWSGIVAAWSKPFIVHFFVCAYIHTFYLCLYVLYMLIILTRILLAAFCARSLSDAEGSTVLHHLARAKLDAEAMLRELHKHASNASSSGGSSGVGGGTAGMKGIVDALMVAVDVNGDTPLLVACDGT